MAHEPSMEPSASSLQELFRQRNLQAEDVRLVVVKGVAYLDGSVASYRQKKAMAADLATLPHVRQVVNRLRVTPFSPCSDKEVAQDIVSALEKDGILSLYAIGVDVDDGVVELAGHVFSTSGKIAAEAAAWSVLGVRHVVNRIQVTPETAIDPNELGLAIKRSLQSCLGLFPSAFDVYIDKGAAILTGSVASDDQRLAAEDLVRYHPLIHRVVNQLEVQGQGQPPAPLSNLPHSE